MAGNTNTTLETPPIDGWERANIMLIGDTGAGKTELRNRIFGRVISPADAGNPQLGITYTVSPDGGLGFYDVEGRAKGVTGAEYLQYLDQKVETQWDGHPEEKVHIVWYCIEADNSKFDEPEVKVIEKIQSLGIAVVVVVTKCTMTDGLIEPQEDSFIQDIINKKIKKLAIGTSVPVCAKADAETPTQFGLDTLLDRTREIAPEAVRYALDAGQRINLERKREEAEAYLSWAVIRISGLAAQPVPVPPMIAKQYNNLTSTLAEIYAIPKENVTKLAKEVQETSGTSLDINFKNGVKAVMIPVVEKLLPKAAEEGVKKGAGPATLGVGYIVIGIHAAFQCEAIGLALISTFEQARITGDSNTEALVANFISHYAESNFESVNKYIPDVGKLLGGWTNTGEIDEDDIGDQS